MALTAHVFPQFPLGLGEKLMNLGSDTLKVGLSNVAGPVTLSTSGVQAAALWTDWKSNVAAEITGTGYTAGGATLTSVTNTVSGDVDTLTCANVSWASATFTANQAVFYDSSAATIQLICFWDFGGAVSVTGATFSLDISGSGLATVTVS